MSGFLLMLCFANARGTSALTEITSQGAFEVVIMT